MANHCVYAFFGSFYKLGGVAVLVFRGLHLGSILRPLIFADSRLSAGPGATHFQNKRLQHKLGEKLSKNRAGQKNPLQDSLRLVALTLGEPTHTLHGKNFLARLQGWKT